jgi:hypothetical protein
MTTHTNNCIEGKLNEDAVGLTAGEREIVCRHINKQIYQIELRENGQKKCLLPSTEISSMSLNT